MVILLLKLRLLLLRLLLLLLLWLWLLLWLLLLLLLPRLLLGIVRLLSTGRHFGRLGLLLLLVQLFDRLDFLLELHAPILEPDLDLPLGETELVRHLYPSPARQVVVGVELLLELERLVAGVRLPTSPPQAMRAVTFRGQVTFVGHVIGQSQSHISQVGHSHRSERGVRLRWR